MNHDGFDLTTGPAQTEPSADARSAASATWQLFTALTAEGFSERQAIAILGQMFAAQSRDDS